VFDIDPFLVQALLKPARTRGDTLSLNDRKLVHQLSRPEADDFLARLVEGDAGVRWSLRKRLGELMPKETAQVSTLLAHH
jgi:hypothetical protein